MAELGARIILIALECGLEYLGYYTMRVLVPVLTLGRYRVAPPADLYDLWGPPDGAGMHPGTAATCGIVLWLLGAIALALAVR